MENEIYNALLNIMGVVDTPIGRRKNCESHIFNEALKEARDILEKYKHLKSYTDEQSF